MIKKECPYCKGKEHPKVIEGYTENQVDHMLLQHIISIHPKMISIKREEK